MNCLLAPALMVSSSSRPPADSAAVKVTVLLPAFPDMASAASQDGVWDLISPVLLSLTITSGQLSLVTNSQSTLASISRVILPPFTGIDIYDSESLILSRYPTFSSSHPTNAKDDAKRAVNKYLSFIIF